jgi:hypothetical protein
MSEAHYTSCASLVGAWAMQSCALLVDDVALIHPCILKVSSKLAQNCKVTAFSGEAVPT